MMRSRIRIVVAGPGYRALGAEPATMARERILRPGAVVGLKVRCVARVLLPGWRWVGQDAAAACAD